MLLLLELLSVLLIEISQQVAMENQVQSPSALQCECDKVTCNCVKRCDCKLFGGQFLEIGGSTQPSTFEQLIPCEASVSSFLEVSSPQDLDCECETVKCDCLKKCVCISTSSAQLGGSGPPLIDIKHKSEESQDVHHDKHHTFHNNKSKERHSRHHQHSHHTPREDDSRDASASVSSY